MAPGLACSHEITQQVAISFTRQPTPCTNLCFSDPQALRVSLSPSRPSLFGFTIVNHERREDVYSYLVTLASRYDESTIGQGRIDVGDNMGATRLIDVPVMHGTTEYVVTVSLMERWELIRFRGASE